MARIKFYNSTTGQWEYADGSGGKMPMRLSELENDSGFVTATTEALINYYTKKQLDELISAIPRFEVKVVSDLPESGNKLTIYLVREVETENLYTEYLWVDNTWEALGSQSANIDLSEYAKLDQVDDRIDSHNLVSYVEQPLTEEQQMQARSNLGLYGKKRSHPVVANFRYVGWWELVDASGSLSDADENAYKVVIPGNDVYTCRAYCDSSYNSGTDETTSWQVIGNSELCPFHFDYDGSMYPFAIWVVENDSGVSWNIAVDSTVTKTMGMGITVEYIKQVVEEVSTIPPEYLPDEVLTEDDLSEAVNTALAKAKESGDFDGEDGGHYTPVMTQPTDTTMRVEFQPSKPGMPAVEPVTVTLPVGSGDDSGENVGLTTEQIAALDGMFKVCAFTKDDISAEYDAFCVAFGIQNSNTCLHPLPDGEVTHDGLTVRVSGGNHVEVIAADDVAVSNGFANLSALNERNATGFPRSALQRNDAIYPTIPTGSVVELSIYNVEYTTLDAFFFEVIFAGNSGGGLVRHIVVDETNSSVTATAEVDWNSAGLGIGNSFKPGTASFDILLIVDGVRWI